ncbi:TetR/AcrR family transcriptional regulator [Nostoc sp. UHCC 0302]|uniref:TetR/AcrR family transcriptional regulator n=1 Tax=Nostoc sp. UHCC 0302 TaxID=3134896 RepID=UPI00311CD0A5
MKQPRDYSLRVTLNQSELSLLKDESERQGVPMTAVIRQLIRTKISPDINSPSIELQDELPSLPNIQYTSKPEQILQGAMQEFLQHGYADTSMERIAATSGVSKQTLYSYFRDKEGLFTALIERIVSERFEFLFSSQMLEGEPKVVLQELAISLLNQILKDQKYISFIRLVFAESGRFPNLAQTFIRNGFKVGIVTLTQYLASHPELKISDLEATARIFAGTVMSYVITMEVLHGKEVMPMESDRLINTLVNLVIPQV